VTSKRQTIPSPPAHAGSPSLEHEHEGCRAVRRRARLLVHVSTGFVQADVGASRMHSYTEQWRRCSTWSLSPEYREKACSSEQLGGTNGGLRPTEPSHPLRESLVATRWRSKVALFLARRFHSLASTYHCSIGCFSPTAPYTNR
jgi:hypothetical protein